MAVQLDRPLTLGDLLASQELQDKGIRQEFKNVYEMIDDRFEEQRSYIDGRFEVQRAYMDTRFDALEGRFNTLEGRFDALEGRFNTLEGRFDALEGRFGALEGRLSNSEIRAINARAKSSWHKIYPVGFAHKRPDGTYDIVLPENFPDRVIKFWRLRTKRKRELVLLYCCFVYSLTPTPKTLP
jgi:predicted nuclease with TOPRIM domain